MGSSGIITSRTLYYNSGHSLLLTIPGPGAGAGGEEVIFVAGLAKEKTPESGHAESSSLENLEDL